MIISKLRFKISGKYRCFHIDLPITSNIYIEVEKLRPVSSQGGEIIARDKAVIVGQFIAWSQRSELYIVTLLV